MRVIGYTYDADTHCVDCALARFGADDNGWVPEGVADSEGNELGAIFTDSESDTPGSCGTCGADIDSELTTDGEAYVRDMVEAGVAVGWLARFPHLFEN